MAPLKPVKKDTNDKQVLGILDIAKRISNTLKERDSITQELEGELESIIKRSFPLQSSNALARNLATFDEFGVEIWNAVTSIIREETQASQNQSSRTLVVVRVFAFSLIDTAFHGSSKYNKDADQRIRNFKISLKTSRFCLDKNELDFAHQVLQVCSDHVNAAENNSPLIRISDSHERSSYEDSWNTLVAEYYLLRVTHAWKSERLDTAELFFNNFSTASVTAISSLAETAADLYYEIGKSLYKKRTLEPANKWFERALASLDNCNAEGLSHNAGELRMSITAVLVELFLSTGTSEGMRHAYKMVNDLLHNGFSNRVAVHLMLLNVLLKDKTSTSEKLREVMSWLVLSAVLTNKMFDTIMTRIHWVRKRDLEVACSALAELVKKRLVPDPTADPIDQSQMSLVQSRIEKVCVTYTLFATSDAAASSISAIGGLQATLDSIAQRSDMTFSAKATHAVQALVWKTATTPDSASTETWYALLRHPLFNGAGQANKAKIGRKAMKMAIDRNDLDGARGAFFQMPAQVQNESLTRYLAFKLAVRSDDYDLATECLSVIAKQAKTDTSFLYACVLEAQQSNMRHTAVAALQVLLDRQPPDVHLPTLLRCTARLLISELELNERKFEETIEEVVHIFQNAASNIQAFKASSADQWRTEVQWWSKNAYNLALRHCENVHPEQLVNLLQVCSTFIEHYPNDAGPMHQDRLQNRKAMCHFLTATALIVLGRSSDEGSEYGLQCYLQAQQEITAFKSTQQVTGNDEETEMNRKMFELLKFDLECILNLQQWDQLNEALQTCLDFKLVDRWDTLADIVLIIHQQSVGMGLDDSTSGCMTELLQRIINDTWHKDKDVAKAARWLRLSFSIDLNEGTGSFALKLLEQAAGMAKKGYNGITVAFPETELQWLATTSFNKAVDLLSSSAREASERWSSGALEIARYAADNGALHANLTAKLQMARERMGGRDDDG